MKIRVDKIAAWIGRALLGALISEAADRLSRPKQSDDKGSESKDHGDDKAASLQPE
ncbi:hypothetical protein SAMN05518849_101529 [Sphingobium sp. AP50]|uniref:hypothetical protein n=1 Tax=Sphingobium sp. AP50 TaxID=1884369 RepID=UPI0008B637E3|nr:hypothetical protein [Sphingobium sp. AP50]SEI67818.1 hypothetical protein SAMN05518849_101529 [Sphingobium sp. AP50]